MELARQHGLAHVVFPSISTGIYGYPVEKAAPVALAAVRDFLVRHGAPARVGFMLYDPHTYQAYASALRALAAASGGIR